MGGTAREQILSAIGRIAMGPMDTFTVPDVLIELRSRDLERVDRGVYRLRAKG